MVSSSDDGTIKIGEKQTNETILINRSNDLVTYYGISYLSKSRLLAAANLKIVILWNLTNPFKIINIYNEHTDFINVLAVSDDNLIASGSDDKTIKIWNLSSNNSIQTLTEHRGSILSLSFLDNSTLITGSRDRIIKIWNITNGKCLKNLTGHTSAISSLLIISNGLLMSGTVQGNISIWNISTSTCIKTLNGHSDLIPSMIQINDFFITTISNDSTIKFWSLDDGFMNTLTINVNQSKLRSIAYSNKFDIMITGQVDGSISIWLNTTQMILNSQFSKYNFFSSANQDTPTIINEFSTKQILMNTDLNQSNYNTLLANEITTSIPKTIFSTENINNNSFESLISIKNDSLISFGSILSPDLNNEKLIIDLFTQTKYDLIDCLSNCSNHGLCKLDKMTNKMNCQCDEYYYGTTCQIDQRPCSSYPCLNSIQCENLLKNNEIDFKCECKKNYYGKRCENKVNLCQNETCSGNGLCKIINENQLNETIKCECFGLGMFEGEKCEIKSIKQVTIERSIRVTSYIAITVLLSLFIFTILMDSHKFLTKPTKKSNKVKTKVKHNQNRYNL